MTRRPSFLSVRPEPRSTATSEPVNAAQEVAAWTRVDPLGEALHLFRMSGTFYTRSEFSTPWGLVLPAMPGSMMFHFVTAGRCRLEVKGVESSELRPGDLALVPHGEGHRLASGPGKFGSNLFDLPREAVSQRYDILRHGGGGTATTMVCGAVRFDHPAAQHLVKLLPKLIRVEASSSRHLEWINSTLRFMAAEAEQLRPGGEAVITRLADILVIQTLRAWIERDPAGQSGWLGALQDPQIGRVLAAVHRDPAHPWTLESLATQAAMSRSVFSARFTEIVGEPAMHYVARWRMQLAVTWLREEDAPIADFASRLGYESEASFSHAFKRFIGVSPGSIRRTWRRDTRKLSRQANGAASSARRIPARAV
jgi:AraC-like DNA-binding protein